jgi:hypothetical protein
LSDSDVHVASDADVERAGGTSHDIGVARFHVGMILRPVSSGTYSVILSEAQRSRRIPMKHLLPLPLSGFWPDFPRGLGRTVQEFVVDGTHRGPSTPRLAWRAAALRMTSFC